LPLRRRLYVGGCVAGEPVNPLVRAFAGKDAKLVARRAAASGLSDQIGGESRRVGSPVDRWSVLPL
jgi:hypothetical protein